MARRKRKKKSVWAKVIIAIVIVAVLATSGVIFCPRLIHHCSNCDKLFFGTGYYANIVTDTMTTISGKDAKLLCQDCAADEHAVAIALGHSLDEYKRPLFEEKEEE